MNFSAGSCISFGWETFKKRPWFFIGVTLLVLIIGWLIGSVSDLARVALGDNAAGYSGRFIVSIVLQTLLSMGVTAFYLSAEAKPMEVRLKELWHPDPFWKYIGTSSIVFVLTVIGFVLFVVPGIILSLMFLFAAYLVIDRGADPLEAIRESRRITKGHRWQLLGFVLALLGINVLGAICLLVGLLVTIPLSGLATVRAYRTLSGAAAPEAPAA